MEDAMSDNEKKHEDDAKQNELPVCTKSFDPESQRLQDDDAPCVDGENRDKV